MIRVLRDTFDLLTFRIKRETMLNFTRQHLIFGLICTWIVGMGRYWDNPKAEFLQHLGVGSVVYIFILALFLLVFTAPLFVKNLSYFRIVTFISLVSSPAILYAIPVERFVDMGTANAANAWFLIIVATWRVALWMFAMRRLFEAGWLATIAGTLLPLALIVFALVLLNLEKAVFNIMGGFSEPGPNDSAYGVLFAVMFVSYLAAPFLLVGYTIAVGMAYSRHKKEKLNDDPTGTK